jgi:hypothetical protein
MTLADESLKVVILESGRRSIRERRLRVIRIAYLKRRTKTTINKTVPREIGINIQTSFTPLLQAPWNWSGRRWLRRRVRPPLGWIKFGLDSYIDPDSLRYIDDAA